MFVYSHGRGDYGQIAAWATLMSGIHSDADIIEHADEQWFEIKRGNMNKWCAVYDVSHVRFVLPDDCVGKMYSIQDIFDAEELFDEYHALRDILVSFIDNDKKFGCYRKATNVIEITTRCIAAGMAQLESTMKHEMQHAIQEYEGLYSGSNVNWWRNRLAHINHCGMDDDTLAIIAYTFTVGEVESRQAGSDSYEQCYDCCVNTKMTDDELTNAVPNFVELKKFKESLDHMWEEHERLYACQQILRRKML